VRQATRRGGGAVLGVALGMLLLAPGARAAEPGSASQDEPHPFLEWGGCGSCHEQEPNGRPGGGGGGTRLKRLLPVCLSCHPGERALHPVGIAPDFDVPTDLLLETDGSIGCVTCHRAHGERYDRHRWVAVGPFERLTPNGWVLVQFKAILAGEVELGTLLATGLALGFGGVLLFLLALRRLRGHFALG
jgi:hypothetical protein